MPDLMTHLLVPLTIGRLSLQDRVRPALLCLGAVLPDLLSRVPAIALGKTQAAWLFSAFHTPVGVFVFCLAAVFLFPREIRTFCLGWILTGVGVHFLLDLLQKTVLAGNYYWFFPFSFNRFQIELFWPDETIYAIPPLLALALLIEIFRYRRRKKQG